MFSALPVIFKQNLRNQETVEGKSVTLCCELSKPGALVNWWKGQEKLTGGEKYHMKTEGKTVEMVIRNVGCEDAGVYSCTVGDQKTTSEIKVRGRFCCSHTRIYNKNILLYSFFHILSHGYVIFLWVCSSTSHIQTRAPK